MGAQPSRGLLFFCKTGFSIKNCPVCFCSLFFICLVFYVLRLMQFQTLCQSNPPLKMFRLISYSIGFIFLRQSVLKRFDPLASELVASAPDIQLSSWNCVSLLFWGLALTLLFWVSYFPHLVSIFFHLLPHFASLEWMCRR